MLHEAIRTDNDGLLSTLWGERAAFVAKYRLRQKQPAARSPNEVFERNEGKALQHMVNCGLYSKAAARLTSNGVCDDTETVIAQLRARNPPAPPDRDYSTLPDPRSCPEINLRDATSGDPDFARRAQTFVDALRTMRRGSAPGTNALRVDHFKALLPSTPDGDGGHTWQRFIDIVHLFANGNAPTDWAEHFSWGRLIALRKKKEANAPRPIVCGDALRRIVGRVLVFHARSDILALIIDMYLDIASTRQGWGVVLVDCSNAFNCVDRHAMLQAVHGAFPTKLYRGMHYTYASKPTIRLPYRTDVNRRLNHGCVFIDNAEGTQQGDPLGGLGFAVSINAALKAAQARLRQHGNDSIIKAYADDIIYCGEINECVTDFATELRPALVALGLRSTATAWSADRGHFTDNEIDTLRSIDVAVEGSTHYDKPSCSVLRDANPTPQRDGFVFCSIPHGSRAFCRTELAAVADSFSPRLKEFCLASSTCRASSCCSRCAVRRALAIGYAQCRRLSRQTSPRRTIGSYSAPSRRCTTSST